MKNLIEKLKQNNITYRYWEDKNILIINGDCLKEKTNQVDIIHI